MPRPGTSAIAPFGLRMQPELRGRIEHAATENGRSMNAEIVCRLEASVASSGQTDLPTKEQMIALINLLYAQLDKQPEFAGFGF